MNENQAVELGRHTLLWVGPRHHHAAVEKSPGRSELQAPRFRKNLQRSRERDMFFLVTLPCAVRGERGSPEGEAAMAPALPGRDGTTSEGPWPAACPLPPGEGPRREHEARRGRWARTRAVPGRCTPPPCILPGRRPGTWAGRPASRLPVRCGKGKRVTRGSVQA